MIPNASVASVLIATALAALPCGLDTTAAVAADLACEPIEITCSGFEPNWRFSLANDGKLSFTDPENPGWETKPLVVKACGARLPNGDIELTAGAPLNLDASITSEHSSSRTIRNGPIRSISSSRKAPAAVLTRAR